MVALLVKTGDGWSWNKTIRRASRSSLSVVKASGWWQVVGVAEHVKTRERFVLLSRPPPTKERISRSLIVGAAGMVGIKFFFCCRRQPTQVDGRWSDLRTSGLW